MTNYWPFGSDISLYIFKFGLPVMMLIFFSRNIYLFHDVPLIEYYPNHPSKEEVYNNQEQKKTTGYISNNSVP